MADKITKFEYYDGAKKRYLDLRNTARDIKWTTDITTAGQLTFTLTRNNDFRVSNGDQIVFEWNNKRIFQGWVFQWETTENEDIKVTAYDNSRYLKGTGSYMWNATSSSDRFRTICKDLGISYSVVVENPYKAPAEITDGKTYFDMIQTAAERAFISKGTRYFIKDDGHGKLLHTSVGHEDTDTVIGDKNGAIGYDFTASIDGETVNRVTVVREDEKSKQRLIYTKQDDALIKKWGPLTYQEMVSDNINNAQLKERANEILKSKKQEELTFHMSALGNSSFHAGTGFKVNISALTALGLSKYKRVFAEKVTHNFDANWTMDIDVVVI